MRRSAAVRLAIAAPALLFVLQILTLFSRRTINARDTEFTQLVVTARQLVSGLAKDRAGARFIAPGAYEITRILAKHTFLRRMTVAAGAYPGLDAPLPSVGSWSFILTRADLPDDVAYRLARALHRGEEALARRLPQARETTAVNTVAAAPRPDLIHAGVLRYLREAGLLH